MISSLLIHFGELVSIGLMTVKTTALLTDQCVYHALSCLGTTKHVDRCLYNYGNYGNGRPNGTNGRPLMWQRR